MKTTIRVSSPIVTIMAAVAMLISPLAASGAEAADPPLLTVDALASKAKQHNGKTIVVHGVVDRVSKQQGMFTLMDPSEAGCTDACERNIVIVSIVSTATTPLPEATKEVLVHGRLEISNDQLRLAATRMVSEPADIKKALPDGKRR